jgi:hypothetical protein
MTRIEPNKPEGFMANLWAKPRAKAEWINDRLNHDIPVVNVEKPDNDQGSTM